MKKHFVILSLMLVSLFAVPARAVDAWYLGGQIGHIALSGAGGYANTIGFGLDLGLRTNSLLDLNIALQTSSHSGGGGLGLFSTALSADVRLADINDFELFAGAGPGFYFWRPSTGSTSNFGINFGALGNVKVDDNIRVGLGFKYHAVLNSSYGSYWTAMMRFGYLFEPGGA